MNNFKTTIVIRYKDEREPLSKPFPVDLVGPIKVQDVLRVAKAEMPNRLGRYDIDDLELRDKNKRTMPMLEEITDTNQVFSVIPRGKDILIHIPRHKIDGLRDPIWGQIKISNQYDLDRWYDEKKSFYLIPVDEEGNPLSGSSIARLYSELDPQHRYYDVCYPKKLIDFLVE